MKYIDEYRDGKVAAILARRIAETVTRPWVLMEVRGGQTHSIVRYGIDGPIVVHMMPVSGTVCTTFEDRAEYRFGAIGVRVD
jgi:hydrogenase expression/formation protein HypD